MLPQQISQNDPAYTQRVARLSLLGIARMFRWVIGGIQFKQMPSSLSPSESM